MRSTSFLNRFSHIAFGGWCSFALMGNAVPLAGNEPYLNKPSSEWTEAEALQVLNDSPWAHTITTTTQDAPCNYEHPAFPGLFRKKMAEQADLRTTQFPTASVKPDGAEYVVRLVSVKPMQAAAERLISLDEKWAHYRAGSGLEPGSKSTDMAEGWYNPADEITMVLARKRPGPKGASFLDYAFDDKGDGVAFKAHHFFACAGIRTSNGQIHAVTAHLGSGKNKMVSGIVMSFPSIVDGKPLITHRDEKLEFRVVLNQRVFETTFLVNPADLLDGSERVLRIPTRVDEPTPSAVR